MSKAVLFSLVIWLVCSPAWAEVVENDLPPVVELFEAPSLELGLSKPLTLAIAGVESGLRAWTLNIEGQSFRFNSKDEALAKAREAWAAGRSFDVGMMQVNSWWLRRYDIPLEAALDPLANIYFGGWVLKQEIARHGGDLKAAIGAYHSPNPARASHYADMVMAALERGPQPARAAARRPAPVAQDAVPQKGDESMTPVGSSMVVVSSKAGLATPASMKAAATRPENSMKVKTR